MLAARRSALNSLTTGASIFEEFARAANIDSYEYSGRACPYVPFESARIVEPPLNFAPIHMLDALPGEVAEKYRDHASLINHDPIAETLASNLNHHYNSILGSRKEYIKYLNREDVRSL